MGKDRPMFHPHEFAQSHIKERRLPLMPYKCSSGTPIFRPKAYKAWVGGVSPRCGIEQIRVGGM